MPPLRGSVKFQCSSTKRWGVSAWVSMTIALAWTWAGVIYLAPVAGVACEYKKDALKSMRMDVFAKTEERVGERAMLTRISRHDCNKCVSGRLRDNHFEDNRRCVMTISPVER